MTHSYPKILGLVILKGLPTVYGYIKNKQDLYASEHVIVLWILSIFLDTVQLSPTKNLFPFINY